MRERADPLGIDGAADRQEIQEFLRRTAPPDVGEQVRHLCGGVLEQEEARLHELEAGHVEIEPRLLVKPSREPDMVGMEMGHEEPRDGPAFEERAGQDVLEQCARRRIVDAGIDQRPTVAIAEQPGVDLARRKGKGDLDPQNIRRD